MSGSHLDSDGKSILSVTSTAYTFKTSYYSPSGQIVKEVAVQPENNYKHVVLRSKLMTTLPQWRSSGVQKFCVFLEKVLVKLRDPISGVAFANKKSLMDVKPCCATGKEIYECFLKHYKMYSENEAKQVLRMMVEYGYIIPLEITDWSFQENETNYTFQADLLFYSAPWGIIELDYCTHLLRRSGKSDDFMISDDEIQRFAKLAKQYEPAWTSVKDNVATQKKYMGKLDKADKKLFALRDYAFWRAHRPPKGSLIYDNDTPLGRTPRKRFNEETHISKMQPEGQVEYLDKKVKYLERSLALVRANISTATKSLLKHSAFAIKMDPFISSSKFKNSWLDENFGPSFDNAGPSKAGPDNARIWTLGFQNVLDCPLGLEAFSKFLEKDFSSENLLFHKAIENLGLILDREQFFEKCLQISKSFIEDGSEHQINIVQQKKESILNTLKSSTSESLPMNIYTDAEDHIYHLMQSASYPRFIASPFVRDLLQ
eukprot:Partr_v1_DN26288_c0_g1_i1_m48649 putative Regulator of G-protein signaling